MRRINLFCSKSAVLSLCLSFSLSFSMNVNAKLSKTASYSDYISKYAPIAILNMQEHGIPASITLAQAVLESGAGQGELARKSNNHFGIKCHSDWEGERVYHDDDKKQECFRKYKTPEQSFEDHSKFLMKDRYKKLFDLDIRDYKGWAKGLKECGYATDPNYAKRLVELIELYQLYNYDTGTLEYKTNDVIAPSPENGRRESNMGCIDAYLTHEVKKVGKVKTIVAYEGDTYENIAKEFDINGWQVRKYNGVKKRDHRQPQAGDTVYISRH